MIVVCPHCGTTVRPGADGTCPACRKLVTGFEYLAAGSAAPEKTEHAGPFADSRPPHPALSATAGTIELQSRRRGWIGILAGMLLCLVLGSQALIGQGNFLIYGFLVFVGMMLLAQIRMFLAPPRLAVRGGWFEARGMGGFRVPVQDVVDLRLVNRHPLVFLKSTSAVEPAAQREALARNAGTRGFHFALPKGSFTPDQIGQVRQALALPPLVGQTPAPDEVFESLLEKLTPHVVVTPLLVAVNVLVFALLCQRGGWEPKPETMIDWYANFGPKTIDGQWWRLLTSMFLHWSIIHLGFNMWILWDVGRIVERLLGNTAYLIVYMTSGFFGSVASVLWRPDGLSAGASGAIFGIFGVLLGFLLPRRDSIPKEVIREHRSSVIAFLVLNLLLGMSLPFIDMAAHVGGLLAGFVCGLLLTQRLSPDHRTARRVRTALIGLIAAAACAATTWYLSDLVAAAANWRPSPDAPAILNRFGSAETPILAQFDQIVAEVQEGNVSQEQAAVRVETEILPPWGDARDQASLSIRKLRETQRQQIAWLLDYARLRQEGWELLVQGLRENDQEKVARYHEKFHQAEQLLSASSR